MFTLRRRHDPVARRVTDFGIPEDLADHLSRRGTEVRLPAGAVLCRKGERGSQAFLLLEGTAQVLTDDGVIRVGPGEVVGEIATLDTRRTRNASVVAETPITALVYDPATYRSLARAEDHRHHLAPAR